MAPRAADALVGARRGRAARVARRPVADRALPRAAAPAHAPASPRARGARRAAERGALAPIRTGPLRGPAAVLIVRRGRPLVLDAHPCLQLHGVAQDRGARDRREVVVSGLPSITGPATCG